MNQNSQENQNNEHPEHPEHREITAVETTALEVMERAQIDMQIATAHRYPRSLAIFMKRATDMVSIDVETAAGCLYSRPVGKVDGVMKYAQGESIRLAEIVAASYGNLRVGAIITEMTPRYVKAVGMAHDLESNYGFKAEVVESTVTKTGAPYSERQRLITAKAAQSKAIRDAIFRVVPKSLCKPIANMAKNIAIGDGETLESRRTRVMKWLSSSGIEDSRVFAALGVEGVEELSQDHLIILTGIRTAIKEGDITIDEAFPKPEAEQKAGTAGLKDVLQNGKKEPPDPEPEKKKAAETKKLEAAQKRAAGKAAKKTAEQAAKDKAAAEDKTAEPQDEQPPRYKCEGCNRYWDELNENGKCPKCFSSNITDNEAAAA